MTHADHYEVFRDFSEENRKLLLQEELILTVTEAIATEMKSQNLQQKDLAKRLNKSKGYISQLLAGQNLTLRTLADIANALNCKVRPLFRRRKQPRAKVLPFKKPIPSQEWEEEGGFPAVKFRDLNNGSFKRAAAGS